MTQMTNSPNFIILKKKYMYRTNEYYARLDVLFVFERSLVHISVWRSLVLTGTFMVFLSSSRYLLRQCVVLSNRFFLPYTFKLSQLSRALMMCDSLTKWYFFGLCPSSDF